MLEKYHNWTHHPDAASAASLPPTVTSTELLTQVSIYWLTNTMSSSMRLYYEFFHQLEEYEKNPEPYIQNPLAISLFFNETPSK